MSNLQRLRESMANHGVEALLLTDITNVQWLTGFSGTSGYAIVTPTNAVFITDSRYAIQAANQVTDLGVEWYQSPTKFIDFLVKNIQALGIKKISFESGHLTYKNWEDWKKAFGDIELVPAKDVVAPVRMIKLPDEIAKIKRACSLTDACFAHACRMIQPGVTELDISVEMEFYFRRQGAELAFEPIVVSGANSARPHGRPTDKKLETGDFVTLDFGAKLDGYCADMTRTVVVSHAAERHEQIYNQVLKAETEAIAAIKPGVKAEAVDALARTILDEMDLAKYFGHGLGHGLGRAVHDHGRMGYGSEDVFAIGQVWTVEPGVYIEDFGGVRIEDDVVVTEIGVDVLTHSPKSMLVLP